MYESTNVENLFLETLECICGKLRVQSLAENFTKHQPNYFSVWEFDPRQK